MSSIPDVLLYILAFVAIWWGAGLIIQSIDKIARKLKLSAFAISFFVLGLLTSIPETAVSIQAVSERKPEIFVGVFLGGVIVLFLLVIPILAIFGRGLKLNHDISRRNLLLALATMALPSLMVIDQRVTNPKGLLLVICYAILFYAVQRNQGIFDGGKAKILNMRAYSLIDLLKVIAGIAIVFASSSYIVDQTIAYSQLLNIPVFYISLLALSLGTNLPELSLAIRAILSGQKDIAFGDYLGSAAANTLLFGIFTLVNDGEVLTVNSFLMTFAFIATGLTLFYFFSQSNQDISVKEGAILLSFYAAFIIYEASKIT